MKLRFESYQGKEEGKFSRSVVRKARTWAWIPIVSNREYDWFDEVWQGDSAVVICRKKDGKDDVTYEMDYCRKGEWRWIIFQCGIVVTRCNLWVMNNEKTGSNPARTERGQILKVWRKLVDLGPSKDIVFTIGGFSMAPFKSLCKTNKWGNVSKDTFP